MICYRIVRKKYESRPLSGEGARMYGGRWNSKGTEVVYAAESLELAMLEMLVHWTHYSLVPEMVWFRFQLPDSDRVPEPVELPDGWKNPIQYDSVTQQFGDQFVQESRSLYARVPSVLVPTGRNILINPMHVDAGKIQIEVDELDLDPRFVG